MASITTATDWTSPLHIEQYLAVARQGLGRAIDHRSNRPTRERWRWTQCAKVRTIKTRRDECSSSSRRTYYVGTAERILPSGKEHFQFVPMEIRIDLMATGLFSATSILKTLVIIRGSQQALKIFAPSNRHLSFKASLGSWPDPSAAFRTMPMSRCRLCHPCANYIAGKLAHHAPNPRFLIPIFLEAGKSFSFRIGEIPHSYDHRKSAETSHGTQCRCSSAHGLDGN